MSETTSADHPAPPAHPGWRLLRYFVLTLICLAVLAVGVAVFRALAKFRKPPTKRVEREFVTRIEARTVKLETVRAPVRAFGTIRPHRLIALSAEVSGRLVAVHPSLKPGAIVEKGAQLFAIETDRVELRVDAAEARLAAIDAGLARLGFERSSLRKLRDNARSLVDVAEKEVARVARTVKNKIGTPAQLDRARQAMLQSRTALLNHEGALAALPARKAELDANRAAVDVELRGAKLDLARCRAVAPARCRVRSASIETGMLVAPGTPIVTLVDLSCLELEVVLSRDELRWLETGDRSDSPADGARSGSDGSDAAGALGAATVRWGTGAGVRSWPARLGRLASVDARNRTYHFVVEIPDPLGDGSDGVALTSGMFCEAELPGRSISQVARISRDLVEDGRVIVVEKDRLVFRAVEIVRVLDDQVLVKGDLDGARLVTSRLPYPAEGMAVSVVGDGS